MYAVQPRENDNFSMPSAVFQITALKFCLTKTSVNSADCFSHITQLQLLLLIYNVLTASKYLDLSPKISKHAMTSFFFLVVLTRFGKGPEQVAKLFTVSRISSQ